MSFLDQEIALIQLENIVQMKEMHRCTVSENTAVSRVNTDANIQSVHN